MATKDLAPLEVSHADDPRVVKEAGSEDYSLHIVPQSWRSSRGSLGMAWYGMCSSMFWVVLAGTVALAVGTVDTLIGMALSVAAYGAINFALTRRAAASGTTVALFSRSLFGYVGAALATLVFGLTAIYYVVFEASVVAIVLQDWVGGLSLNLWYLVVIAYSIPLVFGGVQVWLDRFNGVLLPFYWIGLVVAIVWAVAEFGYSGEWLTYEPAEVTVSGPGWWYAFTIYMGVWVMMMYTWDYARFSRRADERFHGIVTFGPVFYAITLFLNGLIGIFVAHTIPTDGPLTEISAVLGIVATMGLFGVVLIWISQTRINTGNLYLASSNLQSFGARVLKLHLPRWAWAIVAGGIAYLLMLTDVFSFITDALLYQGVLVVGWVGVAMTHLLSARVRTLSPDDEFRPGRVPLVNPGGLAAWLGSALVGVLMLVFGGSTGDTWAPPVTLAVAIALYLIAIRVGRPGWYRLSRPGDPRDEVDDAWATRIRCGRCDRAYAAIEMDRDPEHGHRAICAACASESPSFYRRARQEARQPAPTTTKETA